MDTNIFKIAQQRDLTPSEQAEYKNAFAALFRVAYEQFGNFIDAMKAAQDRAAEKASE